MQRCIQQQWRFQEIRARSIFHSFLHSLLVLGLLFSYFQLFLGFTFEKGNQDYQFKVWHSNI